MGKMDADFDAHDYWRKRHARFRTDKRAVGLVTGTPRLVEELYAARHRALQAEIARHRVDLNGKTVLDVGCGQGDFARYYASRGASVTGIDVSEDAVEYCRQTAEGTFLVGDARSVLTTLQTSFDLIHCFDVLYHIVDDEEWFGTLKSMAAHSTPHARWILAEFWTDSRQRMAEHVLRRSRTEYVAALGSLGFRIVDELPIFVLQTRQPRIASRLPRLIVPTDRLLASRISPRDGDQVVWYIQRDEKATQASAT
jgi:2-polyprenyl-3-methyl-5-hydroxy-6-metoxy-1,4-benzoquinol methylase